MTDVMDPQPKQPKKKSDLLIRFLSSIVLGPPVLAAVYFGGLYSSTLILFCACILAWEWANLCGRGSLERLGLLLIASVTSVILIGVLGHFQLALLITFVATCVFLALKLTVYRDTENTLWYVFGSLYISMSSLSLLWIRNSSESGLYTIFWVLFVVWATDIGAYFSGRKFGGPKIAPAISPNKTWSGLFGGMVSAAIVSYVFAQWINNFAGWELAIAGALLAVVSQAGDFFESHVKRTFDAKDSSKLIPGHGGLFDRVDGLLACSIVVAGYTFFSSGIGF
ncbi:phosphatidate cytidylyltransferase [Kiloniella antarctica]|uniref:Phosphatidate cytidylyltransferase n=1 Tax=Kiloniella antarctica TaxID=1550907 RepID=A0ABW5BMB4_9PROT